MSMMINGVEYTTLEDLYNDPDGLKPEEKAMIKFEVNLIDKMLEAKEKMGMTQSKLANISGLKQPAIARIKRKNSNPQIETIIKILTPLGYKLSIVPVNESEE